MYVVKKRTVVFISMALAFCITLIVIGGVSLGRKMQAMKVVDNITVVIDAGHGGVDPGAIGTYTMVKESDLNLKISKRLKNVFENNNINVVMTRDNSNGLYGLPTEGFKRRDMQKRQEIIEEAVPNIVISVHMNKIDLEVCRGAQVFYDKGSEQAKALATYVQNSLNKGMEYARPREIKTGEFFILNATKYTSIIVECGFLSNRAEELQLQDEDFQTKLAHYIYEGCMAYLGEYANVFDYTA